MAPGTKRLWKFPWSMVCLALVLGINSTVLFGQASLQKTSRSAGRELIQGTKDTTAVNERVMKIFMEKVEILGRIEKPQAVYIVPGTDPKVEDIQLNRSFFEEIFRPLDKDGFLKQVGERRRDPLLW